MTGSDVCERRILASSPGYRVDRCSCGLLHVYAGPITMHMEPKACESFTTVLAKAMVVLTELQNEESQPALRLVGNAEATSTADAGLS